MEGTGTLRVRHAHPHTRPNFKPILTLEEYSMLVNPISEKTLELAKKAVESQNRFDTSIEKWARDLARDCFRSSESRVKSTFTRYAVIRNF